MEFDFPNKDINSISQKEGDHRGWMMLFDGAVNVRGHGIGAVLISPEDKHYSVAAKLTFPCTNNIVDYEVCILGLQVAIDRGIKELAMKGDSALFGHLQREKILIPDALATLATLFKVDVGVEVEPIRIRVQSDLAYCAVMEEIDGKPWFHDIKTYI
ncbi:uncharacterized protein LOC131163367 [Malania oleifera]|uniref:uncharacterized protein LOC131163367 n=1 Tax=Malania oleifera TaxID=397392 RepID=UPI0025AEC5C1|nr:uncharacterized protein LOC131163367 [Malania oleifera]